MAVSSQDILNFLLANPNMSDSDIAAAMDMYGVTPAMMAEAVGIPVQQVQQRYEQVQPQGLFTAPEPIRTPEPVYTPEPSPEPVYTEPAYVAPEPVAQTVTQPVITPEPQTIQEATTMAVTSKQIIDFLLANPNMTDAQIVTSMEQYGVTPAQMATAVGLPEGQVAARVAATVPPGSSITLGDTVIVPQYRTIGSGENQEIGALEGFATSKTTGDPNYKAPVGTPMQIYSADGEFVNTVKTKKDQSFFGGLVDAFKDPVVLAALGGAAAGGLFGGAGALGGATTLGTTGLTAAELAAYDLALGGAGGTAGATTLANALTTGAAVPTLTNLTGVNNAGLLTTPNVASAITPTATGTTAASTLTPATTAASTIPAATAASTAATALTPTAASVLPAAVAPAAASALTPTATNIATSLIPTAVNRLLTPTNVGNLFTSGAQTAAGLLQQQTSREAAQRAQQMIDAETAAAKQSAAFRPIGMTTRFGTSQFAVDPTTGQLTSAGYTLSPEAKNAQDRLVKLAESGLQQAEGAQAQYAPLQTGAQSLFGLGNKYLAQSPEDVAKNYLAQQMALLQPGRELELANLQNKLQQQGRGGLSVAQGGTLGATTPELQALFNARAQQEALLAANAQQYGQQNVLFGAGLLGQGSQAMGQYYGGQQAAYSPYTTALGQVQGLETAAQQPFGMSTALAQQISQAGANVGRLGLSGAEFSTRLATGPAATTNPYSTVLGGVGSSNALGQFVGGLFSDVPPITAMSAPATSFGSGSYYGNQDLGAELGFSVANQPQTVRPTGPMNVNTADMARSLGINLPTNYTGTTTTVNPLLPNQQYAY